VQAAKRERNQDNPPFVTVVKDRRDDWDLAGEQHHGQRL
jgi:hypothetical protein